MSEKKDELKEVTVQELKSDMRISAFSGFSEHFQPVNKRISEWVKHNFRGTRSILMRGGKKVSTPIGNLREGDILYRIYQFPTDLVKLTIVRPKLITELKKRGFTKFEVKIEKKASRQPSIQNKKHQEQIEQADIFIEKVKESVVARDETSHAIEDLMDATRSGKINVKNLHGMVDNFAKNASSDALSAIASLKKSDQTYAHCVDVGAIFQSVYLKLVLKKKVKSVFVDESEMLMGAFLHDFGKSKIPKDILDSTQRFERDSREMKLMQQHPEFSAQLLKKMLMPDYIINMAHYHHVKVDITLPSSYPKVDSYEQLITETRLMAIVDIYQALVGRRSYKKSWAPPAAIRFIEQLTGIEHDLEVFNEFYRIIGQYPIGSLVELNDGSLGFVISVPEKDLSRPQIVVVRNAKGEDLTHQHLVDLEDERDISITKDVDHVDIFGDDSMDVFTNLQIS